jgi:hypothetical protein
MTDLDELEFDYQRVQIDSKRSAISRRSGTKAFRKMMEKSSDASSRRGFYATGNKPSMPRLKCLEKDQ